MKIVMHLLLVLGLSVTGCWAQSSPLVLQDRIPIGALPVPAMAWTEESSDWFNSIKPSFGFLGKGRFLHFGRGGWVYDLETRKLEKKLPDSLYWPIYAHDGERMLATVKASDRSPWYGRLTWFDQGGELSPPPKGIKGGLFPPSAALRPDHRTLVTLDDKRRWDKHYFDGITFIDLVTGQSWDLSVTEWNVGPQCDAGGDTMELNGFSGDGDNVYLCGWTSYRLNLKTYKVPCGEQREMPGIPNTDASWVAGELGANDWSTFVWDRGKKSFLWKSRDVSRPVAFSPNGEYLLCETMIVHSATGQTAFDGLKGARGKFSPDGRSLVTLDDEAFYIYTLPKDSEPIFGVFQKPAPWSPPRKHPSRKRR